MVIGAWDHLSPGTNLEYNMDYGPPSCVSIELNNNGFYVSILELNFTSLSMIVCKKNAIHVRFGTLLSVLIWGAQSYDMLYPR